MRMFRGKRVDNGEWECGCLAYREEVSIYYILQHDKWQNTWVWHEVIPETVKIEVCGQWFNEKELSDIVKKGLTDDCK